jgi:hypothetical protein
MRDVAIATMPMIQITIAAKPLGEELIQTICAAMHILWGLPMRTTIVEMLAITMLVAVCITVLSAVVRI